MHHLFGKIYLDLIRLKFLYLKKQQRKTSVTVSSFLFHPSPSTISSLAVLGGGGVRTRNICHLLGPFFFQFHTFLEKKMGLIPFGVGIPICEILDPNADTTSFDTALLSISNVLLCGDP